MSDDCRQLSQALLAAKQQFTATGKNAKTNQYSYAKIEDIYAAVEPALHANNVIIVHFSMVNPDATEILCTRLIHTLSNQWIQDSRMLTSEKPGNQAKGAANTYMKKYAVLSLCAIATEDDDGESERKYIESQPTINLHQQRELSDLMAQFSNAQELTQLLKVPLNKIPAYKYEDSKAFIIKNGKK